MPADSPAADETVDVSPLSKGARRLYWLAGSVKFGTIFLALGILAPNNSLQFSWGKAIIAGLGVLSALAIAMLMQEDWIRPAAAVALGLAVISAICFVPVSFGVLTGSDASTAVFGWAICPAFFLWLYWRHRRSSRLSDAEIQAASQIGHFQRRPAGPAARRLPPPALWIRGAIGILCAIPVVLVGLVNTIFGVMVISDWIQAALDKLYALARSSGDALLTGARSGVRITVALATSPEPTAWRLQVRGDLFHWGKLGPQRVPFEEFLRTRLEAYGNVLIIGETPCRSETEPAEHDASIVVMPVGVPHSPEALNGVAALGTRMPLLLLVQPIGYRPLQQWDLLARQFRDRGITLPAGDGPAQMIAVLHEATGKNIAYMARKKNKWGYIAAIYEASHAIRG